MVNELQGSSTTGAMEVKDDAVSCDVEQGMSVETKQHDIKADCEKGEKVTFCKMNNTCNTSMG